MMNLSDNISIVWNKKKISEVCIKISLNKIKIKQKDYLDVGKFPIIDQGQALIGGYYNNGAHIIFDEPPYIIFGDHTKIKKYINFKFIPGADGIKVLKTIKELDAKYFYYFLFTINFPDKGYARHFQYLEKEYISFPSLNDQKRIVNKIENLFSEIDKGIESLETAQQQLKVYRQSLLKWAFEGKLTNKDVKDGELPKGWKWVRVDEIASVGTGATPLKGNRKYYNGGKIAWVTSGALNNEFVKEATDYVTELALKETNISVYPKHTLLLAMYGEGKTRGKCSELLIEASTNQAIAAIHFKNHDDRVKPYLKYYLLKNYNDIRMLSSGGVQPNLNLGIVKKTLIPLSSIEEQQLIVDELESRLTLCDKIEETISQSLQQAETLRQSILKKAFEGKLV